MKYQNFDYLKRKWKFIFFRFLAYERLFNSQILQIHYKFFCNEKLNYKLKLRKRQCSPFVIIIWVTLFSKGRYITGKSYSSATGRKNINHLSENKTLLQPPRFECYLQACMRYEWKHKSAKLLEIWECSEPPYLHNTTRITWLTERNVFCSCLLYTSRCV